MAPVAWACPEARNDPEVHDKTAKIVPLAAPLALTRALAALFEDASHLAITNGHRCLLFTAALYVAGTRYSSARRLRIQLRGHKMGGTEEHHAHGEKTDFRWLVL